jgi:hydrogenase maturation protease
MTLVIGVGNPYRGDDGVGMYIAEKVDAYKVPGLSIEVQSGEGATLIDCWQSHDRVYLIDAVAPNGSPGQIHRIEAHKEPLKTGLFHSSTHAFGVLEAIELSRVLDKLPEELIVFGIEGGHFGEGVDLSGEVKTAAERVIAQILREVANGSRHEADSA